MIQAAPIQNGEEKIQENAYGAAFFWICTDLCITKAALDTSLCSTATYRLEDGKQFHLCKPISCNLTNCIWIVSEQALCKPYT